LAAMSQAHIEGLREGYEGINRKDFDAVLALVHPDFVWENDPAGPLGATVYYGRAAVKGFWEDFLGSFDDFHQEPYEFREAAGGKILVRAHLSTYLEGTEEPLRFDTTHLWTIRDDVPVHMRMFFDHGEALEASGLRESGAGRTRPLTGRGLRRLPSSVTERARRAGRRWSGLAQRSSRRR
jgi:ketosteroid isomerase-like protein